MSLIIIYHLVCGCSASHAYLAHLSQMGPVVLSFTPAAGRVQIPLGRCRNALLPYARIPVKRSLTNPVVSV